MKAEMYCRTVLVIGGGPAAMDVSARLTEEGWPVVVAAPGEMQGVAPGAELFFPARVTEVTGQVGDFKIRMEVSGDSLERLAGFVVLAPEPERRVVALPADTGIGGRIWSLTEAFEKTGGGAFPDGIGRVVFLDRLDGMSTPASVKRLFTCAVTFQERGDVRVRVLTNQVKVAEAGLELLYGRLRESGGLVLKTGDVRLEAAEGGVSIRYRDGVLDEEVALEADVLVVAEEEIPSSEFEALSRVFRLERDLQGFLQADNVLRKPCLTNRRGVLVAGPSGGAFSQWETDQDIAAAVSEIRELQRWLEEDEHPETIVYNRDYCAFCLTCFRVCPHAAIHFTDRPHFLHLACQSCGLCASACPGEALELFGYEKETFFRALGGAAPRGAAGSKRIVAIACRKSAARLLEGLPQDAAVREGFEWVEVPCAGTIRTASLLQLLARGEMVEGVLVLACHEGNCRSGTGTVYARALVESVKGLLRSIGADPARIGYLSTAANDGVMLQEGIMAFRNQIR